VFVRNGGALVAHFASGYGGVGVWTPDTYPWVPSDVAPAPLAPAAGAAASLPQALQNRWPSPSEAPHRLQAAPSAAPQALQNRAPGGLSP
jgi:hypothetical protein